MDIKSVKQTQILAESLSEHCQALLATVAERDAVMKELDKLRKENETLRKGGAEKCPE